MTSLALSFLSLLDVHGTETMTIGSRTVAFLVAAFLGLVVLAKNVDAQQPPAAVPQGSPQQSGPAGSSGTQNPTTANPGQQDALDNPLLEQTDEERNITYMESHVSFKYRHDAFDGGASGDSYKFHWLQSFGPSHRMAAGIELPFVHASGEGPGESSVNGLGDITLDFRGMLGKSEKFEHAAGLEITLPSASNDRIGDSQTVLKFIWGCSAQLTTHTLLSAEVGYNKAVQNQRATPGVNNIEPEIILSQAFAKRVGGYLDWDNYYEFNVDEYVQTLEIGLEIALDRQEKWTFSPYVLFPLSHASRIIETKNAVGVDVSYQF